MPCTASHYCACFLCHFYFQICVDIPPLHSELLKASKITNVLCTQRQPSESSTKTETTDNYIFDPSITIRKFLPDKLQLGCGSISEKQNMSEPGGTCGFVADDCKPNDASYDEREFTSSWKNPLLKSDKLVVEYVCTDFNQEAIEVKSD